MRLFTLLRDLFNTPMSSFAARMALREAALIEREKEERYRIINKMIWEYNQSPAYLRDKENELLISSDESMKEGAD